MQGIQAVSTHNLNKFSTPEKQKLNSNNHIFLLCFYYITPQIISTTFYIFNLVWYCVGTVSKNTATFLISHLTDFIKKEPVILFANTKDDFHTSIEFAPIMQFQGLEIYFLINRCTKQSLKSNFFTWLFKHTHNLCFLELIIDKRRFSQAIHLSHQVQHTLPDFRDGT